MSIVNELLLVLSFLAVTGAFLHKRTNHGCHEGSAALKEVLQRHPDWMPNIQIFGINSELFTGVIQRVTGHTMDNFPDDFLCDFADVTDRNSFVTKLHQLGYLRGLFNLGYNIGAANVDVAYHYMSRELENPNDWTDVDEVTIIVQLMRDLKASGILDLDPEGKALVYEIITSSPMAEPIEVEWGELNTGDGSTEYFREMSRKIANDIRKLWNHIVRKMEGHSSGGPDGGPPGEFLRNAIFNWTGIDIPHGAEAHELITNIVFRLLLDSRSGIDTVYMFLYGSDVLRHLTRQMYPHLAMSLRGAMEELQHHLYNDMADDTDGRYSYGYSPVSPETMDEILTLCYQILEGMNRMGLLNLE